MQKRKIQKKFIIKIPENVSIIYSKKNNLLTLLEQSKNYKKSIKLTTQIFIIKNEKILIVSPFPFAKISSHKKKSLKAFQGTTVALIKYILVEISVSFFCQKMKFIGVGYRAFPLEINNKKQILHLKLGYSHQIYFKFINEMNIFCFKFTKLFIFGNSYKNVTQFSALIRSCKTPEPYKGKGILYDNEKIVLKIGKKI